jgi:hypothetical protein
LCSLCCVRVLRWETLPYMHVHYFLCFRLVFHVRVCVLR